MQLTTETLQRFVGGQLEIHNPDEHYLYRGEIESAEVEPGGVGDKGTLKIRFRWFAKMGADYKWHPHPDLDYEASLYLMSAHDISDDRIHYSLMFVGESGTFYPPDGSKLDPNDVEGLAIPA